MKTPLITLAFQDIRSIGWVASPVLTRGRGRAQLRRIIVVRKPAREWHLLHCSDTPLALILSTIVNQEKHTAKSVASRYLWFSSLWFLSPGTSKDWKNSVSKRLHQRVIISSPLTSGKYDQDSTSPYTTWPSEFQTNTSVPTGPGYDREPLETGDSIVG